MDRQGTVCCAWEKTVFEEGLKVGKALESVNKSIKGTQSGLKDVNKLLKLDPSNEKPERYPCGLPLELHE